MTMTKEEAKKMEGTEFTYVFESGDSMSSYVKKVDEETGQMSCWSFSLITEGGKVFEPYNKDEEKEGACCVLVARNWTDTLRRLEKIKTGRYEMEQESPGFFHGCIF